MLHSASHKTYLFRAFGAITGADGSAFSLKKGGKLINNAFESIGTAFFKKGVHPNVKKSARKTFKKAAKYIGKSFACGLLDYAYDLLDKFTAWYANKTFERTFER